VESGSPKTGKNQTAVCAVYIERKEKKKRLTYELRERVNLAKEKKKNMVTRKCQSSSSDRAQSE
jgi:hypothetical protein